MKMTNFRTSSEIGSISHIVGEESAVELVAMAGFDAWDFSLFDMWRWDKKNNRAFVSTHPLSSSEYLAFSRRLRRIGENCGIRCNQSHAPHPSVPCGIDNLLRSIECTAEVGAEICVIHPDNNSTPEQNAEMYLKLLPYAKACGVKIATENMWNWNKELDVASPAACSSAESFIAHLKSVDDPYFVACLDIGHAEMRGLNSSASEMIYALGDKLCALHIHDNRCLPDKDDHLLPFDGNIDFDKVASFIAQSGYEGTVMLEVGKNVTKDGESVYGGISDEEYVLRAIESANRLLEMINSKR